jgi:CheY-like chemotaxis protein
MGERQSNDAISRVEILLVEDDPGHARLIEKNLRRANLSNPITFAADGEKALDFLFQRGEYVGKPFNNSLLVLLDLNLPIVDGYQVLRQMKSDERTRSIPVVVLTTTDDAREIKRCYELGCNVFLTKPVSYERFGEAINNLGLFISVVSVPKLG